MSAGIVVGMVLILSTTPIHAPIRLNARLRYSTALLCTITHVIWTTTGYCAPMSGVESFCVRQHVSYFNSI